MTKLPNTVLTEWGWRVAYSIIEQSQRGRARDCFFFFLICREVFAWQWSLGLYPWLLFTLKRGQEGCGCSASTRSQRRRQLTVSKWFSKTCFIRKQIYYQDEHATGWNPAGGHVKWHRAHLGESDLFAKKKTKSKENPQIPLLVPNVLTLTDQGRLERALFKKHRKTFSQFIVNPVYACGTVSLNPVFVFTNHFWRLLPESNWLNRQLPTDLRTFLISMYRTKCCPIMGAVDRQIVKMSHPFLMAKFLDNMEQFHAHHRRKLL